MLSFVISNLNMICRLIMYSKILLFSLGALQFLSQIGCLALNSPSSSNGISLCYFLAQGQSLYNISESLGGIYTLSIKICFPFISSKFEMASRLDYILLTKTLLISSFIKAATPNPSFFLSKS